MKFLILLALIPILACHEKVSQNAKPIAIIPKFKDSTISYEKIKSKIIENRIQFASRYRSLDSTFNLSETVDFWIKAVGTDLYEKWRGTPWDFNGTTTAPQQGMIACGYFVTTILKDMDLKIDRVKLAVCPSMQMMKSVCPSEKIRNLSRPEYTAFNNILKASGKGVYIIGLDLHTGFIVNDGNETWFIHSNYIQRQGVIKERVANSAALKSSKTRWLVSLTGNKDFLLKWLRKA